MYTGKKTHLSKIIIKGAMISKPATPTPDADADPLKPKNWPEPILLANKEAPTGIQCIDGPARKYSPTLSLFLFDLDDLNIKKTFLKLKIKIAKYPKRKSNNKNKIYF